MAIVLVRVDERLLHGQVIIGWGHELRPDRYVLVDDDLAASDWEQEFYRLAVSGAADVVFSTVDGARARLGEWRDDPARTILLVRDIPAVRRLSEGGALTGQEINLGGLHHGRGRQEVLPYLYLSESDFDDLRVIAASGVEVSARDLPDTARVPLAAMVEE